MESNAFSNRLEVDRGLTNVHVACFHRANVCEAIYRCFAIIDNLQRGDTLWAARSGDRGNSRSHGYRPKHSVARWRFLNQYHGGRKPNISTRSIGQASQKQSDRPKTLRRYNVGASPLLHRPWRLRAPSTHRRDVESNCFIACASICFWEASGGMNAMMDAVTLICSPQFLSAGRCVRCCVILISWRKRKTTFYMDPKPHFRPMLR